MESLADDGSVLYRNRKHNIVQREHPFDGYYKELCRRCCCCRRMQAYHCSGQPLTNFRAKAQKQELAEVSKRAAAAAAVNSASVGSAAAPEVAADCSDSIGDPAKDRRRKISNFARFLGIDPHKDGSLMWIAGDM